MTSEKLAELEKLRMASDVANSNFTTEDDDITTRYMATACNSVPALIAALREAWKERDEARSVIWNREAQELVDAAIKERDEARAALEKLRKAIQAMSKWEIDGIVAGVIIAKESP